MRFLASISTGVLVGVQALARPALIGYSVTQVSTHADSDKRVTLLNLTHEERLVLDLTMNDNVLRGTYKTVTALP